MKARRLPGILTSLFLLAWAGQSLAGEKQGNPFGELKNFFSTIAPPAGGHEDEKPEDHGETGETAADVHMWRYGDRTLADLPELEAYVNSVAGRILAVAGLKGTPPHVYVAPDHDFGAFTLPKGGIFVSLGTLLALDNEDELAALLGHEIAHVKLGHHKKDAFQQLAGTLLKFGGLYLQSRGSDWAARDYRKVSMASWAAEKALFPAWSRTQESTADAKGTDLMIAAGYNASAMVSLLKKVRLATESRQEVVAVQPASLDQLGMALVTSLEKELSREHALAVERQKAIRQYLKEKHRKRPRPMLAKLSLKQALERPETARRVAALHEAHEAAMALALGKAAPGQALGSLKKALVAGEDPYVRMLMFNLQLSINDAGGAMESLNRAYASGKAPFTTYRVLAEEAVRHGDLKAADRYITEANKIFNFPKELLPVGIYVNKRLRRFVAPLQLRCLASGDQGLIARCNQAAQI